MNDEQIEMITCKTLYRDGGDGSQSFQVHPDLASLRESEFVNEWDSPEEIEESYQRALSGESPYDYGEIGDLVILVKIVDGKPVLARPFGMSAG